MTQTIEADRATDGRSHAFANHHLRETAKWIVVGTFASLVVLLGGTSLSSAGYLFGHDPDWVRIGIAAVGGCLCLLGLARLVFDALGVMTFQQFSLIQYACGAFEKVGRRDAATEAEDDKHSAKIRLPRRFVGKRERSIMESLRDRLERQFEAEWPEGISSFEQLARLNLAVESCREDEVIEGTSVTFFCEEDRLVARSSGKDIALPGERPFHLVTQPDGTIAASGKAAMITYTTHPETGEIVLGDQGHTVSREDIDYFAQATYNAALFHWTSLCFEYMQRRMPLSIVMVAVGAVVLIAAINPPPPPQQTITTQVRTYDEAANALTTTTTTAPLPLDGSVIAQSNVE